MGESPRPKLMNTSDTTTTRPSNAVLLLTATALDTTWRTLIPGIAGLVAGLFLDRAWHTTPWLMIVLLVLGMALSVYLVYRQFKGVQR
jgi:F0F1-type ATP synthase assembly protein I